MYILIVHSVSVSLIRHAARDPFDAHRIMSIDGLDWSQIKAAVLAIGSCSRRDWRTMSVDAIKGDPRGLRQKLAICLPRDRFADKGDVDAWIEETVALCRERFAFLFDLTANEREFLDNILDRGEIDTNLLDVTPEIRTRIGNMPMLARKSRHVRKHRRLSGVDILDPEADCGELEHGEEALGELVVSGGDGVVDLEPAEHALDAVAVPVQDGVPGDRRLAVRGGMTASMPRSARSARMALLS